MFKSLVISYYNKKHTKISAHKYTLSLICPQSNHWSTMHTLKKSKNSWAWAKKVVSLPPFILIAITILDLAQIAT